jgi:hypothetical protein
MTSIEQPFNQPTISVTELEDYPAQHGPVPYTHNNLGEAAYGETGGTPDRYINDQEAHPPFYGLGETPQPYPL